MSLRILYVTATALEARTLNNTLNTSRVNDNFEIHSLVTGVGSMATSWAMQKWIIINGKPDLAINAGIAGSYREKFAHGDVVMPVTDCFADSGIEDDENYLTLFEAGFINHDELPYKDGRLHADSKYVSKMKDLLTPVNAITVNTSTGSEASRIKLLKKFNPDIETMEGATFFYICCRENIPFLALRAISNRVEKRNRNSWNIALALDNLSGKLQDVLLTLL
jgi:futalosine hydrolase